MINELHKLVKELREPTRLMDVLLHECIIGELDVQVDYKSNGVLYKRVTAREWGDILVDRGSERVRIRVPTYTKRVEHAVKLLPRNMSFALSYIPKGHPALQPTSLTWAALLRDEYMVPALSAQHDLRPAFAICELAVMWVLQK